MPEKKLRLEEEEDEEGDLHHRIFGAGNEIERVSFIVYDASQGDMVKRRDVMADALTTFMEKATAEIRFVVEELRKARSVEGSGIGRFLNALRDSVKRVKTAELRHLLEMELGDEIGDFGVGKGEFVDALNDLSRVSGEEEAVGLVMKLEDIWVPMRMLG